MELKGGKIFKKKSEEDRKNKNGKVGGKKNFFGT